MPRARQSGFTLIELLVVISIIALLIAILLPALSKAREAGRSAQCLSNQRQIVIGLVAYSADFGSVTPFDNNVALGGVRPMRGPTADDSVGYENGLQAIGKHAMGLKQQGNKDVFLCPTPNPGALPLNYEWSWGNVGASYGQNGGDSASGNGNVFSWVDQYAATPSFKPRRLDDIKNPSRLCAIADVGGFNGSGEFNSWPRIRRGSPPDWIATNPKHNERVNWAAADGHAAAAEWEFIQQPGRPSWQDRGWNLLGSP